MPILLSPGSEERPFLRFEAENISNYTALLLSRDGKTLYVGAREALFALNSSVSFLPDGGYQELLWSADADRKQQCSFKGKDPQRDCQNYIKILLPLNSSHLFACGTAAFSPICTYIVSAPSDPTRWPAAGLGRAPLSAPESCSPAPTPGEGQGPGDASR